MPEEHMTMTDMMGEIKKISERLTEIENILGIDKDEQEVYDNEGDEDVDKD